MRKLNIGGVLLLIITALTISAANAQPAAGEKFKQEFLYRINKVRQQGCNCGTKWMPPVAPLVWNVALQKSAYGHAKDMSLQNYFSHTSKDGRSMEDRIVLAGYIFNGYKSFFIGENIARGQESIQEVMDAWFKSEDHCHNLMSPLYKEVGAVQYNDCWVQDFGGREPYTPAEQKALLSGRAKIGEMKKTESSH
jgi:uncharacterized protein YkwD